MDLFEAAKTIPTRTAAESYGITVSRNGMAYCPFHRDKTPSIKLDRRFHCFGCQADGDVITFTAQLFNLSPREAAEKLTTDFGVPYEGRSRDSPEQRRAQKASIAARLQAAKEYQQAEDHCHRVLCDYFRLLQDWKDRFAPKSPEEMEAGLHPLFVEACHKLDYTEYLLDLLLYGSIEERSSLVREYGKDVLKIEKRILEFTTGRTDCRAGGCPGDQPTGDSKAQPARSLYDRAL